MKDLPDVIIYNFQDGIGDSPHTGFGSVQNLDILTVPGIAKLNYLTSKDSSTNVTDFVKWIAKSPSGTNYALGDTQRVYSGANWPLLAGNSSAGGGNGLVYWKNTLFAFGNTQADVYYSGSWTNAWMSSSLNNEEHPALAGQDDIVYFGNLSSVGSIAEVSGSTFNPGNAATYTQNNAALTLPSSYRVTCLAELGQDLLVGTKISVQDFPLAKIYPWDRSSATFRLPIILQENGIQAMVTVGNWVYVFAGTKGNIYITNGSQTQFLRRIPIDLSNNDRITIYPGSVFAHQGRIFFGVSQGNGSVAPCGLWSMTLDGKTFNNEYTISTGTTSSGNSLLVGGATLASYQSYYFGWRDNTSYGIDLVSSTARFTSYGGFLVSQLFRIGTAQVKRNFSQIEFVLANPLTTGQGIRLSYRTDTISSFTAIGTYDFSTYGAIISYNDKFGLDAENIQIKVELTTGSNSSTSPYLREVRLR